MINEFPTEEEVKEYRKKGYTNMEIVTGIASAYETPGRLAKVTIEQWQNAETTCMKK